MVRSLGLSMLFDPRGWRGAKCLRPLRLVAGPRR
jgi:hypothetical protein